MTRRHSLQLLLGLALGGLTTGCRHDASSVASTRARVVSLAPAITETLFIIGAESQLVAVSDYCDSPEEATKLPRVGTSITPNYEAIARLAPTLIVSEKNASSRRRELEALAHTDLLPWLTLQEIASSVRELGRLTERQSAAKTLAEKLLQRLDVPSPSAGPRVLLVLGGDSGVGNDIWFIRRNSLHGAALHAAGARNALDEDVHGPPQLSQERLLALDPDVILVLSRPRKRAPAPAVEASVAGQLERFVTLRAVQQHRLASLEAPEAFANGPRILNLVERLHAELVRLGALGR